MLRARESAPTHARPLTLTLSPEYWGEGTGKPPRVPKWAGITALIVVALVLAGCKDKPPAEPATAHDAEPAHAAVSNRIDVPDRVRQNLGITFAKVERRRVAATLRVPGRFELPPSAKREYRSVLPARVELLVGQYARVEPGQVIARLDSPEWRRVQHEAVEAEGEIAVANANIEVAEAFVAENARAVKLLRQRTAALAEANASRAELTTELALAEGKAARLDAEARAARVKLAEANEHYASKLRTLASVVGMPAERLTTPATQRSHGSATTGAAAHAADEPLWKSIETIEVRATAGGVVESLAVTNGGWVEQGGMLLATVDPSAVRFRGVALQSDLGRLREGAAATIVAPAGAKLGSNEAATGKVAFGLEANAETRTLEILVTPETPPAWARPGVTAFAEVVTADGGDADPAIPVAAVVQDELSHVYFRRDPSNPDKVIRVEADLGVSDGRWVVVKSGLKAGDEVVVDGVFELKLAGGGKAGGGGAGHFHADGTWHAAGTPEPGGKK